MIVVTRVQTRGAIAEGGKREVYIIALLTSPIGITPSFSPFFSCEKSLKASLISFSSSPVILCSFARADRRALEVASTGAAARGLAGYNVESDISTADSLKKSLAYHFGY